MTPPVCLHATTLSWGRPTRSGSTRRPGRAGSGSTPPAGPGRARPGARDIIGEIESPLPAGPVLGKAPRTARHAARTAARSGAVAGAALACAAGPVIRDVVVCVSRRAPVGAALCPPGALRAAAAPPGAVSAPPRRRVGRRRTSCLNRRRRVIEMRIGVAVGVGLGDVLVRVIGHGAVQLALTVLIAMTAALLLDGGALVLDPGGPAGRVRRGPPAAVRRLLVGRWEDALHGRRRRPRASRSAAPADPRPELRGDVDHVVHIVARALRAAATPRPAAGRPGGRLAQALELARTSEAVLDGVALLGAGRARTSPACRRCAGRAPGRWPRTSGRSNPWTTPSAICASPCARLVVVGGRP